MTMDQKMVVIKCQQINFCYSFFYIYSAKDLICIYLALGIVMNKSFCRNAVWILKNANGRIALLSQKVSFNRRFRKHLKLNQTYSTSISNEKIIASI